MLQRFLSLALLTSAIAANPSSAAAQVATPILTLPATITKPGIYTIKKNLVLKTAATSAITINADNVTIDLGGHVLSTTLPAGTDVAGIRSEAHGGLVVQNGTVRGFRTGVRLNSFQAMVSGVSTEGLHVDASESIGIQLLGLFGTVKRCTVTNIGGPQASSATGLFLDLGFAAVLDNDILATVAAQGNTSEGIHAGLQTSVIENNRVLNEPNTPGTIGIFVGLAGSDLVENNRITNFATGLEFSNTPAKYRNNFTAGCTTPYVSGTDAGNNK